MLPYLLVLILVMSWIFVEDKALNRRAIWVPAFILIIFASIRDYTIGTDTPTYTKDFRLGIQPEYYEFDYNVELGHESLIYFLLKMGVTEYYWFFFVTSIMVIIPIFFTIRKYSVDYKLSIYIFITFAFYTFYFNTLRQGIAISICLLGIKYILEKSFIKYFLIVFVASLFHISAWIMLLMYFLVHLKVNFIVKIIGSFLASIIGSSIVVSYMASSNVRYEKYNEVAENAGGYYLFLFYVVIAIFIYIFGKSLRVKSKEYNIFEQIYIYGIALVFPIILLGSNPSGPQRIFYYFGISVIFLLPYIFNQFNSKIPKNIFIIFALIYFILVTQKLYEIYPYILNPVFELI